MTLIKFPTSRNITNLILDCVHTRLAHFENGRKFDGKNSLQDFDAKEKYLHPKNRPFSTQKREKCSLYIIVECSHDAVSNLCRVGFRFQNLPFSKSAGKKCAVFV